MLRLALAIGFFPSISISNHFLFSITAHPSTDIAFTVEVEVEVGQTGSDGPVRDQIFVNYAQDWVGL